MDFLQFSWSRRTKSITEPKQLFNSWPKISSMKLPNEALFVPRIRLHSFHHRQSFRVFPSAFDATKQQNPARQNELCLGMDMNGLRFQTYLARTNLNIFTVLFYLLIYNNLQYLFLFHAQARVFLCFLSLHRYNLGPSCLRCWKLRS